MSAFEELGVMPELVKAVEELGWMLPSPVQAEAIPLILGGGDVMAAAETGSGKTGAFAIPVLQIVHEALRQRVRSGAAASSSGRGGGNAGGGVASPAAECVLSTEDRDLHLAVSSDGCTAQSRSEKSWGGVRATMGVFASCGGKVYYEVTVNDEGLSRVGWSCSTAALDLGTDRLGFGFGGTGKKSHQRQFDSYGEPFGKGDVIGCMLDCTGGGSVSYSKNGRHLGEAFKLPPHLQSQIFLPAICLKNAEATVNFGVTPFAHPPPPGFIAMTKAPAAWIAAAASAAAAATSSTAAAAAADGSKPDCIILEPAKDLAEQTANCFTDYGKHLHAPAIRTGLFVGGVDAVPQIRMLREGVHIAVGTPGRVIDFVESGKIPLDQVRFFVLDEADRLIADNPDVVTKIYNRLPKGGTGVNRLQVLLFSATLHSTEVKDMAAKICVNPILVDLKGKDAVPETVDHVLVRVNPAEDRSWLQSKPEVFTDGCHAVDCIGPSTATTRECLSEATKRLKQRLLQRLIDTLRMEQCLIFCRTNYDCDQLERFLNSLGGAGGGGGGEGGFRGKMESGKENPYSCVVLAGARSMDERRAALSAFKDGDVRFLICTDVAARGIDIKELPYVINMTLPDKSEDYIHRIGRVGRADTMGLAISLVSEVPEKVWYCSVKGLKPWLAPDASNTKTTDKGGHTIWYDEKALLGAIETRLGRSIPSMSEDLSLPAELAERLAAGGDKYGQQRGGGVSQEVTAHLEQIAQNVQHLASLEWHVQTSFLRLKQRWQSAQG
ncbi:hypothetical protein VOLCADRAFT_90875 [Volvox carteri f. nagariensis]|uniref:DEAD box protein 1 n=1 Tax=Volvox carteri f. nagariensis TaxID=3068 RepID=D8TVA6_VOLCA|nr:uncharacterized protein VOLCADRAFT_90875 [Volvox carteri f. nagariensis]EFJ48542.1 hypothetical protein VOLCADRAFT_90875 [Volvox carteri f. nagariensis]|eukprot:XP_002950341.1 hypothetical protein VOLCADRAFT_90875 [Volvox carteri f. nagariensis]